MATKRKTHAAGSDIYARVARDDFNSALCEYDRLKEFEYVFGERYYLHLLSCVLDAIQGISGLEESAKEFTEFSDEIKKVVEKLDKKYLRSQRDQYRRRLKKYYRAKDEEALDLYELKRFNTWFRSYVEDAIELLDKIIAP